MRIQVLLNKVMCTTGGIQSALSRRDGVALILRGETESSMEENPILSLSVYHNKFSQ